MAWAPSSTTWRPRATASSTSGWVSAMYGRSRSASARYSSAIAIGFGPLDADRRELVVLAIEHELQLEPELGGVEQVAHAQADAACLVDVRGSDAAPGRAQAALLARLVFGAVEALVVRHDQVRGGADAQAAGVDLARAELVQLGDQQARVHGDARPDDAQRARIEDAGRNQVYREAALLIDDGMASVRAPMATYDQVRVAGQQVDDLAFALVAPVAADNRRDRHETASYPQTAREVFFGSRKLRLAPQGYSPWTSRTPGPRTHYPGTRRVLARAGGPGGLLHGGGDFERFPPGAVGAIPLHGLAAGHLRRRSWAPSLVRGESWTSPAGSVDRARADRGRSFSET